MYKKQGINNNNDYLTLYFSFRALKAKKEKKVVYMYGLLKSKLCGSSEIS